MCLNKDLNVATNSSANDKSKRTISVTTKTFHVATEMTEKSRNLVATEKEEELRIARLNVSQQRFLCRNTAQQTTGIRKMKSIATKKFPIVT